MSKQRLGTLDKAYAVLQLYERAENLSFTEIVEMSGIERGAVQRIIYSLESLGLLKRHQRSRRYSLSSRFLSFAVAYLQADPLTMRAVRYLETLTRQTKESVGINIMDGIYIYHISQVPSLVTNDFSLLPSRSYAINTAAGRAIMSALPPHEVDEILRISPRRKLTRKTLTNVDDIWKRIQQARQEGIAAQAGETSEGEICLSAPILGEGGYAVAAVTMSISEENYSLAQANAKFSDMIKSAAESISSLSLSSRRIVSQSE
jgi:IclR family transcriptional regulator, pca regulon regulatory protein